MCITTSKWKLAPQHWSAPSWERHRSCSTQDSPAFIPSNERPTREERGQSNNRGRPLRRVNAFLERRPSPRPPVSQRPPTPRPPVAPTQELPVYLTIAPPPYLEPTPSYHLNLPVPVIPPLSDRYRTAPLPPTPLTTALSGGSELLGKTFQNFLLEDWYLALTIPTRDQAELHTFHSHCWYLLQNKPVRYIEHPASEVAFLTPDPAIFSGYIWKYRTTINKDGILEDYRLIHWSPEEPFAAHLYKAHTVFYSWTEDSYTVTLV